MASTNRDFNTKKKVVFAAMSKSNFYMREHVIKFILEQGYSPTCAFMMFSYFLLDTVDRNLLISANNDLIRRSDELWVFGSISNGVVEEIKLAQSLGIPVRYFKKGNSTSDMIPEGKRKVKKQSQDSCAFYILGSCRFREVFILKDWRKLCNKCPHLGINLLDIAIFRNRSQHSH